MTTLLELLGAVLLWKWADRQDEKAEAEGWDTVEALMDAPLAAARWNMFHEEHSQVDGESMMHT